MSFACSEASSRNLNIVSSENITSNIGSRNIYKSTEKKDDSAPYINRFKVSVNCSVTVASRRAIMSSMGMSSTNASSTLPILVFILGVMKMPIIPVQNVRMRKL